MMRIGRSIFASTPRKNEGSYAGSPTKELGNKASMRHMRSAQSKSAKTKTSIAKSLAAALVLALPLGGCFSATLQKGYIVPEGALEQIPVGASQEQVLIVLGTPSTVATVSGEAFYYISQRSERPIGFMPQQVVDQRGVALYFDKGRRVERLANYGLKDGKVFDFVSRTTPTGGKDYAYVNAMFKLF